MTIGSRVPIPATQAEDTKNRLLFPDVLLMQKPVTSHKAWNLSVLTPEIFRPLYSALVRPILEYGQQASSPYLQRDIALMERIQRLATRMVKGMRELPYEDRLRRLNIFSFERRRLRGDLILAYNIFHGRLDLPRAEFFEAPSERDLRGHDYKLRHRNFRLLRRKAAFSVRLPIS